MFLRRTLLVGLLLLPRPAFAQCDDRLLSGVAAELLLDEVEVEGSTLTERARAAGSDLPVVHGLVVPESAPAEDSRVRRFLSQLGARAGAPVRCGEARSEGRRLILAGPSAAGLRVENDVAFLTLAEGWREARLHARDARGQLWQREFVEGRVPIPSDLVRPLVLQAVATGPRGPRPVAERRLGEAAARSVVRSDESVDVRLARLRRSAGVSLLRPNRLLERVALRHAEAICDGRPVGHVGEGGDPVERLAREGIRARHVGETAARARSVDEAHAAALESPSHRAALVDRRMTDRGVGVARQDGHACVVVLLAAWPRAVPYR